MNIFLTVSKTGAAKFRADYQAVLKELEAQGAKVVATFTKGYLDEEPELKEAGDITISEDQYRYANDRAVRRGIFRADAVVIEASYPSFRLGFEAFFGLSIGKPVLVLSKFRNYGHLIDQPNLFGAKYTEFTLPDEIEKFLRHVRKYKLRNRFNMFISDDQKKQLEDKAKRYGISQSDYLRKLIDSDQKSY